MKKILFFILIVSLISKLIAISITCSKGYGVCCSKLEPKYCKCTRKKNNCPYYFPACTDKKHKRVVKNNDISLDIFCE